MALVAIPQESKNVTLEKISRKFQDGILEVVLLVKGEIPTDIGRVPNSTSEIRLDETHVARVKYCPNGLHKDAENLVGISVAINSTKADEVFVKVECDTFAVDGTRCFPNKCDDFYAISVDSPFVIQNITSVHNLLDNIERFEHKDGKLHFEVRISLDTKRSVEIFKKLKECFHNPEFGDTTFIAGGVKLYGHLDIIKRNGKEFWETFKNEEEPKSCYDIPDAYPQEFVHVMACCYLAEKEFIDKHIIILTAEEK